MILDTNPQNAQGMEMVSDMLVLSLLNIPNAKYTFGSAVLLNSPAELSRPMLRNPFRLIVMPQNARPVVEPSVYACISNVDASASP